MTSCNSACLGLKGICACFTPVNQNTRIDLHEQLIPFLSKLLQSHGVCVAIHETSVYHYDCRIGLQDSHQPLSVMGPASSDGSESKCPFGQFQCQDKHCDSTLLINDHSNDCPDGSDETFASCNSLSACESCKPPDCHCSSILYQCPQGGCLLWDKVGDGEKDCEFGEDELQFGNINIPRKAPQCDLFGISLCRNHPDHPFLCDNTNITTTITIPSDWVNDLIPDCPLSDDEPAQTDYSVNLCYPMLQCTAGHPQYFPVLGLCVFNHDQYGHLQYCRNGAYLDKCEMFSCSGYFKCPSSYCVPVWKLCDNITDCPNGEDENSCVSGQDVLCPGFLRCKGGDCVHPLQVCDGQVNCHISPRKMNMAVAKLYAQFACDCLGAAMSCYEDKSIDVLKYKAFFRVDVAAESVLLSNGSSLFILNISKNVLSEINSTTFHRQPNLVILDISSNKICRIEKNAFIVHAHLTLLNLEGNQIKMVEIMAFSGLQSLTIVDLSMHNISNLEGILTNMSLFVKLLNVSYNFIRKLDLAGFNELSQLATIDIRFNRIYSLFYLFIYLFIYLLTLIRRILHSSMLE